VLDARAELSASSTTLPFVFSAGGLAGQGQA
jgi:hypothetical protein